MTLYAGEEVRITTTVSDFDGTVLAAADVNSVKITTIHDSTGTQIAGTFPTAMSYDVPTAIWYFMWDTAGLTSGTYKAKVTVTGLDNTVSWEWKRIRLARDLT